MQKQPARTRAGLSVGRKQGNQRLSGCDKKNPGGKRESCRQGQKEKSAGGKETGARFRPKGLHRERKKRVSGPGRKGRAVTGRQQARRPSRKGKATGGNSASGSAETSRGTGERERSGFPSGKNGNQETVRGLPPVKFQLPPPTVYRCCTGRL